MCSNIPLEVKKDVDDTCKRQATSNLLSITTMVYPPIDIPVWWSLLQIGATCIILLVVLEKLRPYPQGNYLWC